MKSLMTACLTLLIVVGIWQTFMYYADAETDSLLDRFDNQIMPAMEAGEWERADREISAARSQWQAYTDRAHYFLDNTEINDADKAFGRTLKYIEARDLSNSSGELLALRRQISYLRENEKTTLQNIL